LEPMTGIEPAYQLGKSVQPVYRRPQRFARVWQAASNPAPELR
jgi:hypothetical protein